MSRSSFPSLSSYYDKSLRPPPESGDAEEDEMASWDWGEALIDCVAYMIDERNHTSARSPFTTRAGEREELQVTFCLAPPPHVSYFCMAYTSGARTLFINEPLMLATEGNLALICVKHGPSMLGRHTDYNFFVYHAPTRGSPRLQLLPHPEPGFFPRDKYSYFTKGEVGILRYCTRKLPAATAAPEEYDACKIATIYTRMETSGITHYHLFTYDSKTEAWTREPAVFLHEEPAECFTSDRVLATVDGTMVWVDLSQGIILCDLLEEESPPAGGEPRKLRYVRLPKPLQKYDESTGYSISSPFFYRDITLVDGRIKFVDLELHNKRCPGLKSWTVVTWSMSVGDSGFRKDGEVNSADAASSDALDLGSFVVAHPTLSSDHAHILYLMAKASTSLLDHDARVIALDMKNKKMERVAKYTTQRHGSMASAYRLTTISNYLAPPADSSKGNMKRRGQILLGSSHKKPHVITLMSGYDDDQVEGLGDHNYDLASMSDDEDNMDLG